MHICFTHVYRLGHPLCDIHFDLCSSFCSQDLDFTIRLVHRNPVLLIVHVERTYLLSFQWRLPSDTTVQPRHSRGKNESNELYQEHDNSENVLLELIYS